MASATHPRPGVDPVPTAQELIARAQAMIPALKARAARCIADRDVPEETIREFHEAGFFRILQPRRWGGMELPFPAIVEVPAVIAEGCASTSWDFHALANHSWILGMYDDRAQEEVWADDPDALIAAGIAFPQGRGRKVDGGYEISGYWNFCSGVNASPWCMFATTIRDRDDGPPVDYRMCLVRAGEYEVIDDWQVLGMRGTGSQSCKTSALFVPEHRALPMLTIRGQGDYPGARVNSGPLFRVPLVAAAGYFPSPTAIGNAVCRLMRATA